MLEKRDTRIVYIRAITTTSSQPSCRWNSSIFAWLRITFTRAYASLFVLHGRLFDTVTKNFAFLSHFGDWGLPGAPEDQPGLQRLAGLAGKEYWSLSKAIKPRQIRGYHVSKFEDHIAQLAKTMGASG